MAIKIEKINGGYKAEVTPPHGNGSNWKTTVAMSSDEIIKKLLNLGCHQTDIGDAFYEADPNWLNSNQ